MYRSGSFILLLALSCLFLPSSGQDQELIICQGHRAPINMVIYSPDGKYIFSAGEDRVIKMWDVNTGIDVATFYGHNAGVNCLEITRDGATLISGDKEGRILVWNPAGAKEPVKILDAHQGSVGTIRMMPDNSGFVSGGADKMIKLWDLKTGTLTRTVGGLTGEVRSVGISPDGKRLISGGYRTNDVELLLIDLENGTILDDAMSHVKGAGAAKVYTYAILTPLSIAANLAKGNVNKDMLSLYIMNFSNIEFTRDGSSALVSQNIYLPMTAAKGEEEKNGGTTVSVVELNGDRTMFQDVTRPKRWVIEYPATRAMFNEDQTKIIANVKQSIMIYDMTNAVFPETTQEAHAYEPPVLKEFTGDIAWLNSIALSPDYRTVASAGEDRSIKLWDINSGRMIRSMEGYILPALAVEVMPDRKHMLVGSLDQNMTLWDITTGQLVRTFERSSDVNYIDVSEDGNYILTTAVNTKFSKLWNFKSGNIIRTFIENNDNVIWAKFDEEPDYMLAATENGELKRWSISENKIKKNLKEDYRNYEDKYRSGALSCEFSDYSVQLKQSGKLVFSDRQKGKINDAVFSLDSKYLITANDLGEICLYNLADNKLIVSMAQLGNADYITYTPDFYYTSSKGASRALAFRSGENILPFEQMELRYNRPDIVAGKIGYAPDKLVASYRSAWEKRLTRLGFTPGTLSGELQLPVLKVDYEILPLATTTRSLSFDITARDDHSKLKSINVYINDVPVFGSKGIDLKNNPANNIQKTITIDLSAGLNRIKTSVINENGLESIPETFEINYDAEYYKPSLYIAAIGISKYKDADYNLAFAAKDAGDIISALEQSEAFSGVYSRKLTDEEATATGIKSLRSFLDQAAIDDVVIVFIAGHGVLDKNYTYYFAAHDMDFLNPSNGGLTYEELEQLLDGIRCRNKLLFMDTCHSGELDRNDVTAAQEETKKSGAVAFRSTGQVIQYKEDGFGLQNTLELSKNLFSDLRKGTGATVISAAGGTEFALEGLNSPNGLFTSCFLEGISTRRADLDRNRYYTVSEFRRYISERVISLSEGKQVPTSREENIGNDFRIY